MKIQLMSDLHIEFRPSPGLLSMPRSLDLAGKEVYYATGNPSSTTHTPQSLQETFGGLKELGVRVTYLDSFKTRLRASKWSPVRFVLATLWSDLSNPMDVLAAGCLNDFRVPSLTIDRYNEQHQLHKAFIKAQLEAAAKAAK